MNLYKPLLFNVFCCVLLVGCGALPRQPAPEDGFVLKGKLAIEDAGERHSASFHWRQEGQMFEIDVWGPLGQGRIHLQGDQRSLTLLDGQGEVVRQGDPETVMRDAVGWSLPLDVLNSWVLGRPDPDLPAQSLVYDAEGQLASFDQAGWNIQFAQYREMLQTSPPRWLPRRIDARRTGTKIRLIIADWQI